MSKHLFEGSVLDIGCGVKPYQYLFTNISKYEGIDFKHFSKNNTFSYSRPDYYFSKDYQKNYKLNFTDNSYSNTVAFQVLEHHQEPKSLISEMFRITKSGGYIFLTAPFLGGIHEEPYDFQRYTKYGLTKLFENYKCKLVELESYGSISSTISMLLNEYLSSFVNKGKIQYLLGLIIYFPFLIFQYISLFLDFIFKSNHIVTGYLILVKKL